MGNFLNESVGFIWSALVILWPFITFVMLFSIIYSTWLFWRQSIFKYGLKWVLLEIKMPREVKQTPAAMEQVLIAMHQLRNVASDLDEVYWDGEVTRWFSLEIASFSGETHFYIRLYHKHRGLVEAAFYSHYPDIELVEVEDYTDKFPKNTVELDEMGYDMWGGELALVKEEYYPIRSYAEFVQAPDEDHRFDPISTFLEIFAKLEPGQTVAIQILIQPFGLGDWKHKWESAVEKLREPRFKKQENHGEDDATKAFASLVPRSPGETDVLEAIDRNLSKPAFDTLIRFIYFSPKSTFYDSFARRGLLSCFNQYASADLNSFRHNYATTTRARVFTKPYIFSGARVIYRKNRVLYNFPKRYQPSHTTMGRVITSYLFGWNFASKHFKLNTEAIATLFHPPMSSVLTAPHMRRVESRRTGPPAGLAIFGSEGEIEKFK